MTDATRANADTDAPMPRVIAIGNEARVIALLSHAIATEAHRAETVKLGSVHEGAGPKDIAQ